MTAVLITLHIILAVSMICIILLQRSEGGGFGSSQSTGSFFSVRGKTDFLTRTTAILATAFIVNCFILALLASQPKRPIEVAEQAPHTPTKVDSPAVPATQKQ
ncbi:MAG: preprotein translocase subunit SecG [Alphaproteobacteria bacterium]|nr:preprotein translocase subunit SecG [Alphaproteobacteria bacterium]